MKKKFISVALFGALMLASTSVVTSCKDYDDDISGLQSQVTDNKKTLDEQIAALNTALESTKADVVAAQTTANEAVQAAKDAQSTGDEALKEAADAKADAALATQAAAQAKEEAIEAAKAEVEALRQEIENMPEGDFVTNDAFTQKVNDLNSKISAIQEGLSKLEGLQGIDVTVNANAQAIEQLKNQMTAVEAYKALIDANASDITSLKNKDTEIDNAISLINSTIANLATSDDLEVVEDALSAVEAQIEKINSNLSVLLRDELRSLVFKSGLYVDGIEAAEYGYLTYTTYAGTAMGAAVDVTDNEGTACKLLDPVKWNFVSAGSGEYNPTINVAYHLNPSSAKVNKEDLSFISRDVEVVTREASAAEITLVDKVSDDAGILTVSMKATGSKIKAKGEGSIFALQAVVRSDEKGDTTITSDYAMLYASTLTPKAIAFASKDIQSAESAEDCSQTGQNDHLYDTPNKAISKVAQVKVRYDNKDGIDLKELMEMHYDWDSKTKNNGTHKIWKYGEEAQYGLTYEFNLIDYTAGSNTTSDSKYAALTDGVLYARTVNSEGETTGNQGPSSIGKHPLVQVLVKDINGNVVLDGYIKIEITDAPENAPEDMNTPVFDLSNADFGCDDLNKTLTWAEISDKLYEVTAGASKEEFEDRYKFDVDASSNEGKQYDENHKLLTQSLGVVTEMPDPQGTTNNVLNWELTPADLQAIYEKEGHTVTIYVKYASQYKNTYGDIYMPLKVTVIKNLTTNVSKKNVNFWFAADGTPNDALDQAIRLNVPYPQDGGDPKPYTVDADQAWEGNIMSFSNAKVTASKYYFHPAFNAENISIVGSDGTSYRLTVGKDNKAQDIFNASRLFDVNSANEEKYALNSKAGAYMNNELYANNTKIAELNQSTGEITYLDNATAKAVLNSDQAQHSASGLYVYLGICASNSCDYVMPVSNDNPFKAFFLRPVDVKDNGVGEFVDGKQNGSTVDVAKLFNFIDWRDVQFVKDGNYDNSWLYAFYGFSSVKVDVANATTNMNGNDINTKKLTDVNPNIKLTQVDNDGDPVTGSLTFDLSAYNAESAGSAATFNAIVAEMGKIKYENQGLNVSDYDIRIPVEFTYDWGTIKTYVVCKVTRTQGN